MMKAKFIIALVVGLASTSLAQSNRVQVSAAEVPNGTNAILTSTNFFLIKNHIMTKGDWQTYCNMYNHNPHIQFGKINIYLNPDTGQANINCDPNLSGFNEMVIRTEHNAYYHLTPGAEKKSGIVIRQYYREVSANVLITEVERHFKTALAEIEKRTDKQSNQPDAGDG